MDDVGGVERSGRKEGESEREGGVGQWGGLAVSVGELGISEFIQLSRRGGWEAFVDSW